MRKGVTSMKKGYIEPEMELLSIRSDEHFAASCGYIDRAGNNESTAGISCVTSFHKPGQIPYQAENS